MAMSHGDSLERMGKQTERGSRERTGQPRAAAFVVASLTLPFILHIAKASVASKKAGWLHQGCCVKKEE